jgi:4-hydroxybenzoate polyprenyltransferase
MEAFFELIAELAFDLFGEGLFKKLHWLTHLLLGSLIIAALIFAYVFRSNIIIVVMMLLFALMFTIVFIALKKKDEDM